jgi:hypothetical protein
MSHAELIDIVRAAGCLAIACGLLVAVLACVAWCCRKAGTT